MSRLEFVEPASGRLWYVGWEPERQTWFAAYEAWPPKPASRDTLRDVVGGRPGEIAAPDDLLARLAASHGLVAPPEVIDALRSPGARSADAVLRFWTPEMIGAPAWRVGTEHQRWEGYLDPNTDDPDIGGPILRNKVGARSHETLRRIEDARFGLAQVTLRAEGHPRSYDLDGFLAMHRHLFGSVYEWAGELRTVNMDKGESSFLRHGELARHFSALCDWLVNDANLLRAAPDEHYPVLLANVYNQLNTWHGLRETNGRTNREFLSAVARESGRSLDWSRVHGAVNDRVSILAMRGNLQPMTDMIAGILGRSRELPPPISTRVGIAREVRQRAEGITYQVDIDATERTRPPPDREAR